MSRFTITDLRDAVERTNTDLIDNNSTIRYVEQGRNGYRAIDQYSVNNKGKRIGSGVDCNVGCGTARECAAYMREAYLCELLRLSRAKERVEQ